MGSPMVTVAEGTTYATAQACLTDSLALPGEFWECGVYRGAMAEWMLSRIGDRVLRLFDTFRGCPPPDLEDAGGRWWAWEDTSLALVQSRVHGPLVFYHVGRIPETFVGLEQAQIAFAYVDLTLYQGTRDALAFIVPRLVAGGTVLIRDYYGSSVKWPGLVKAVDDLALALERHNYDAVVRAV